MMRHIQPDLTPAMDPGFLPSARWTRKYREAVSASPGARPVVLALARDDGTVFHWHGEVLPAGAGNDALNLTYLERTLKFLLWMKGGNRVLLAGAPEVAAQLAAIYSPSGARAFDWDFVGARIYGGGITVEAVAESELPPERESGQPIGRHLAGRRIGFDLGGSDRKAAAVVDGEVVWSGEVKWDPYFQSDPAYHYHGISDSLKQAASHLPGGRPDAIGGSAAGVYVNNQVRAGSLYRGIPDDLFAAEIRGIFDRIGREWGVPLVVANDGEVTALAGSMALGDNAVLGISMGTSLAAGYVDVHGNIKPWLNELAFAPVDHRADAPVDEWSGDRGCGVQYFSQQGVARLANLAGFDFQDLPFPEQLEKVQAAMANGDERAAAIYQTIGACFGHTIAHYADFYTIRHVLILGRVTSGLGGRHIIDTAHSVLAAEYPALAASLSLTTPNEQMKRHGQAVAAASLPALPAIT